MADAGHEAAAHLAEMAHAETGYGRVDHKTFKNIFCTRRYLRRRSATSRRSA